MSMPRLTVLAVAAALLSPDSSFALLFEPVPSRLLPQGIGRALWVRDCGNRRLDDPRRVCADHERRFSPGDGARLSAILASERYDEIWLASGGGALLEGIEVGEALRRAQATVRVPSGFSCVSSCTIAFLGGLFRYVDEGATYEVHASSGMLEGFKSDEDVQLWNALSRSSESAEAALRWFSDRQARGARTIARRLFWHAQVALMPLNRPPSDGRRLRSWLEAGPRAAAVSRTRLRRDAERIQVDGAPAAQDILMRIEREAMGAALAELRGIQPELGPHASHALDMLDAMYSTRILGTASLNRDTLLQMGYVTSLVQPGVVR